MEVSRNCNLKNFCNSFLSLKCTIKEPAKYHIFHQSPLFHQHFETASYYVSVPKRIYFTLVKNSIFYKIDIKSFLLKYTGKELLKKNHWKPFFFILSRWLHWLMDYEVDNSIFLLENQHIQLYQKLNYPTFREVKLLYLLGY